MKRRALINALEQMSEKTREELPGVLIGRVENVGAITIDVQPVIARQVGNRVIQLPRLVSVPPIFLQGGATYDAHPVSVGDYCLVIVTERAYDRWYNGVDGQPPVEVRFHDYSDGFALVGVNPNHMAIPIPANTITRKGDSIVTGNYIHSGNYTLAGDLTQTGAYSLTGEATITINLTVNNTSWNDLVTFVENHTHSNVSSGPDNSGAPNGSIGA